MAGSSRPKVDQNWAVQQGLKAQTLAATHASAVDPRLSPGLRAGLDASLTVVGATAAAPVTKAAQSRAATADQNTALTASVALITAISGAARRKSGIPAGTKKRYGVGARMQQQTVKSVVGVGRLILESAAETPDEARAIGILDPDLALLREQITLLENADTRQESIIANKPLTTRERNATINRIYAAIVEIAAAGQLAFALDPVRRAEFDALDDLPKKRR